MRIRASAAAAALALVAGYGVAHADGATQASITAVNGTVLVNQGQGYRPAAAGQTLHIGDRVIVTTHGGARLMYAGGCGVSLAAGSMATIGALAPCKVGLRKAGVVTGQPADGPPVEAATPFGLSPGLLAFLTVGVFTVGAAGLGGAFDSNQAGSP